MGGSKGLHQVDTHSLATLLFFSLLPLLLIMFQFYVYPLKLRSYNRIVETHQEVCWKRPLPNTNLDERGISQEVFLCSSFFYEIPTPSPNPPKNHYVQNMLLVQTTDEDRGPV